jgi:transcriptional regulator with XRE-family HTH domain
VGTPNESGIGNRLRATRERRGWSREELAVRAGLSWSAIAQTESGRRRNPRPATLSALCSALGVPIDYLVSGGETPPMLIHRALLYDSEESFAEGVGRYLQEGVERSEPGLAVTSKKNVAVLRDRLGSDSRRVQILESKAHYTAPENMLGLFRGFLEASLEQGSGWVRIVGEPLWSDRSGAEVRLWTRYEALINLILAGSPTSLLCPYDLRTVDPAIVADAHATHPQMVDTQRVTDSPGFKDPAAFALQPE